MLQILTHLIAQHEQRLVLVAGLVGFAACFTAFRLYSRMRGAKGVVRAAWLLLTGLVAGSGVWAAHFIAMVAFDPGLKTGYSPTGTLLSLMIAVVFMAGGFAVASAQRSHTNDLAGGLLLGVGVAAMHYVGMSAFVTQGAVLWEHATVAASVILGVAGSTSALMLAGRARSVTRQAIGGGLLALGVGLLHFTGMAAVTIVPDPSIIVPDQLLSGGMVTFAVAAITVLVTLGGLGAVTIESQTSRSALDRIRRLANAAYEGIVVVQDGRINDVNAAFCVLAGAESQDLVGKPLFAGLMSFDSNEESREGVRREGQLQPLDGGRAIPIEVFARLMDDGARTETSGLTVLAVRDLRERRSAEEKIRYLAEHDGLTGLPNRNSLQSRLAAALDRVEASGESLALICVDLDHFKEANDLHGHLAGDALLVEAARRLQDSVTAPSFAARLGGDEFIIVQIAAGDQPAAAAELAGHLLEALSVPAIHEGQPLVMAASLGVSLFPDDGRTAEALLANADMALYRAKESGRGVYRFFKREMDDSIRERRTMARELRQAIIDEELIVYYQPLARASDGEVCGFEALVRWLHPVRGMIPPLEFIPVAEESGLIGQLGEWVLRRACADAAAWQRPLRIAVNLSPLQLNQPDLPKLVHEVLIASGLSPHRLELEVTESALFKDYQRALDNLRRLKALGVRIAMDDFGTGFSSLSTLQSFPFDKIKIDKSFVEDIHRHDRATVIVRAVLGLGRSLDIPVVAEGVETEEQINFLRGEDCAELQGYAIGRPAPVENITIWTNAAAPAETAEKITPVRRSKRAAA
ncbi:EAL domain-containing protein [Caulobacter sp. B11]|uniref:bifunctional diguanylate cyclase/phosphodiesterase n=1 Tax=Caulobacter sp. B11 TaxID=2048899 RepID=UPI003514C807